MNLVTGQQWSMRGISSLAVVPNQGVITPWPNRGCVCRCIQNSFWLWEPYPVVQGWLWGNKRQSKMLTALLLLQAITTNNLDINFGTVMIFGGILEGVWPINNQKRCWLCDIRCQSNSGVNVFLKHLRYSICKSVQWRTSCYEWLTTV